MLGAARMLKSLAARMYLAVVLVNHTVGGGHVRGPAGCHGA